MSKNVILYFAEYKIDKYYLTDLGIGQIMNTLKREQMGAYLENIVYNELAARGYTVFAGKTYKGEVDFVAVRNGKKCFIQVAYLMTSEETVKREFGAYRGITDASPKYVMSLDRLDMSHDGIVHLNIIDFLLGNSDLMLT